MSPAAPTASVIVVSRHRNLDLLRCLTALAQLDHPAFEVVVVADPAAAGALQARGDAIKVAAFDEENISEARNIGLVMAAGEVVAFLDDDAVPEPSWLRRLIAVFDDPDVGMAGGFVRGFNGISYQFKAQSIDRAGRDHVEPVPEDRVSVHAGNGERSLAPLGTNMAFRRAAVLAAGGFDRALKYHRDESDLALRLAAAGWKMAVVPDAQVHHGRAESSRRSARRVPVSLFEVGASSAVFLRRHAGAEAREAGLAHLRAERRAQLRKMMFAGKLKGRQVHRLLVSLEKGIAEGQVRALPPLQPLADRAQPLLILPGTGPRQGAVIAGRSWQRLSLARRARAAVAEGRIVTLFRFSPTTLYHRMRFVPEGYWAQSGGLFGRSERTQPLFRCWRFAARLAAERERIAAYRPTETF